MSEVWQKKVLGFRLWGLVSLVLFYSFFGYAYYLALYLTSEGSASVNPQIYIDYGLKILLTIPVWWLLFKKFDHWNLWKKVLAHLIILPIWLLAWQRSYYGLLEFFGHGHLTGAASWWDIYIPGLFYILQFGVFHGYDYYIRLQKQHELEKDLRELTLKSELTALKAQLNPHFLYNIFNTISASLPSDQEHTRELIAKLSDIFRYQLKGSKLELVLLKDELEFVRKYLELEKARFGKRLKVNFEIDEEVNFVLIPPMILQPLVENAVKHGISKKLEGGVVDIKAVKKGRNVHIEICDSGVGIENLENMNDGIGLENTRKRLEKIYQSTLILTNKKEGGLCVHFDLPIV